MSRREEKPPTGEKRKDSRLAFPPEMDFEEIVSDLLKIKPVENADLKPKPKKKSKPKK